MCMNLFLWINAVMCVHIILYGLLMCINKYSTTHTHTYMHICVCVCIRVRVCVRVCVSAYVCECLWKQICVNICAWGRIIYPLMTAAFQLWPLTFELQKNDLSSIQSDLGCATTDRRINIFDLFSFTNILEAVKIFLFITSFF